MTHISGWSAVALGQQAQHRKTDQEAVGRRPCALSERRGQRIALRGRQAIETVQQRRAQLVQAGEGEVHVGFDAGRARDAKSGRALGDVVQQCGLADARLAAQHENLALPRARGLDQAVQRLALVVSAKQALIRIARHSHRR